MSSPKSAPPCSTDDDCPIDGGEPRAGVVIDGDLVAVGRTLAADPRPTVRRLALAPLLAGPEALSVDGAELAFAVDAGSERAGDAFFTGLSFTGTSPGLPLGAALLPLNLPVYSAVTLPAGGDAVWSESFGTLDEAGTASPRIALPALPPALTGTTFHGAAAVVDPLTLELFTTPPAPFAITP